MGLSYETGFLGPGQETGSEEALPVGELAHLVLQILAGGYLEWLSR